VTSSKASVSIPRSSRRNLQCASPTTRNGCSTHLGIQAENGAELEELGVRLAQADVAITAQKGVSCCYAKSDKYWTLDPQGVPWESFHTLDSVPVYGEDRRSSVVNQLPAAVQAACCVPAMTK
jgi:hypothetical protein